MPCEQVHMDYSIVEQWRNEEKKYIRRFVVSEVKIGERWIDEGENWTIALDLRSLLFLLLT